MPVALKAGLVNNPPDGLEGRLYGELGRSKIAPQGICIANSAGKALAWVAMFDDQQSVLAFLNHGLQRFQNFPDASRPVAAERYMRFPSAKLDDVQDDAGLLTIVERHLPGEACPAKPPATPGTLIVRVVGRALDADAKPVADTTSQQTYVEERFDVPLGTQAKLVRALASAPERRVRIPEEFARVLITHAYLGELDVQPLSNPSGGKCELPACALWGERVDGAVETWRIEGTSEVYTDQMANAGPGDFHEVKLTWQGYAEVKEDRIVRLLLSAEGREKLRFGTARRDRESLVSSLPAGRRIDVACGVRFGFIGAPAAAGDWGQPAVMLGPPESVQDKMQSVQRRVQEWQRDGKSLEPIARLMQRFEPLVKQGNWTDAEGVLDEALNLLGGK
ncbi:MAG TPA: hypothetical protein VGM03_03245 [Phycisphaerae bacterium]